MNAENNDRIKALLDQIPVTPDNKDDITDAKIAIANKNISPNNKKDYLKDICINKNTPYNSQEYSHLILKMLVQMFSFKMLFRTL